MSLDDKKFSGRYLQFTVSIEFWDTIYVESTRTLQWCYNPSCSKRKSNKNEYLHGKQSIKDWNFKPYTGLISTCQGRGQWTYPSNLVKRCSTSQKRRLWLGNKFSGRMSVLFRLVIRSYLNVVVISAIGWNTLAFSDDDDDDDYYYYYYHHRRHNKNINYN